MGKTPREAQRKKQCFLVPNLLENPLIWNLRIIRIVLTISGIGRDSQIEGFKNILVKSKIAAEGRSFLNSRRGNYFINPFATLKVKTVPHFHTILYLQNIENDDGYTF